MVSLQTWAVLFLAGYLLLMVGFGYLGWRRTTSQEDYATARGSYGWPLLGLAFVANLASGITFLGHPGITYAFGFKGLILTMGYPIAAYGGVLIAARLTKKVGDRFKSQSVPDFLGDRYDSSPVRVISALIGFGLLFYVMAQIAAAAHMFDIIFGVDYVTGVWLTAGFLAVYIVIGGSHADILTDGVQGAIMLVIVGLMVVLVFSGWGLDGGVGAINGALEPSMRWDVMTQADQPFFANWWVIILGVFVGHFGFVTQPHIGNKFFALRNDKQMKRFLILVSTTAVIMTLVSVGGLLGRANGIKVENVDAIIPALFVQFFPPVVAAFLGVAILSAIISTSDGVVVSLSQLLANDIYRKSYVPWKGGDPSSEGVNNIALWLSRIIALFSIVIAAVAVISPPKLLAVFVWIGIGGIIASYSGPYFVGLYWGKTTEKAAVSAMIISYMIFMMMYVFPNMGLYDGSTWYPISANPFASAAIGFSVSVALTVAISFFTSPPPEEHIDHVFRTDQTVADGGTPEAVLEYED